MAAMTSGSRLGELGQITAPTLVIHGKEDPIVHHAHAQKLASLIPGAKLVLLEGIGHEVPVGLVDQIHANLFDLFAQVE